MSPPPLAGPSRLRVVLLIAVIGVAAVLVAVIVADPRRVGVYQSHPGRSPTPGEATWVLRPSAPVALTEVAAAAHQGRVWVAGGLDSGGKASSRVLAFDPASGHWSDGPALPTGVHHAALVSDGASLWLLGGYLGGTFDRPTASVLRLDEGPARWIEDEPLPAARAAGAAAWDGRRIVYAGGVGPTGAAGDVFARGTAGSGWRRIGSLGVAREHLAAAGNGSGSVMFLGGRRGDLGNLAEGDEVRGDEVRRVPAAVPTARGGVAAFFTPSLGFCLVGGEGPAGTFGDVECASANEGAHARSLPGLRVPRHGLGASVVDGVAYALLGGRSPGLFVSDVVESLALP
ncbi:MAG TPA: kelch repeat-containing protein [Candidatus Limnocylindrales bacterium]